MLRRTAVAVLASCLGVTGCSVVPERASQPTPSGGSVAASPSVSTGSSDSVVTLQGGSPQFSDGPGGCKSKLRSSWRALIESHTLPPGVAPGRIDPYSNHLLGSVTDGSSAGVGWIDATSRTVERTLLSIGRGNLVMAAAFSPELVTFAVSTAVHGVDSPWKMYAWDRTSAAPVQIAESELEGEKAYRSAWPGMRPVGKTVYWVQSLRSHPEQGLRLLRWTGRGEPVVMATNVMPVMHHLKSRIMVQKWRQEGSSPDDVVVLNAKSGRILDERKWGFLENIPESVQVGDDIFLVGPAAPGTVARQLWQVKDDQVSLLYESRNDAATFLGFLTANERWIAIGEDGKLKLIDRRSGAWTEGGLVNLLLSGKWATVSQAGDERRAVIPVSELEGLDPCTS